MFSKLLKRTASIVSPVSPAVPEGAVVWSIGDIHGRLDLLRPLVAAIQTDLGSCSAHRKLVIFLGDYIDRGPESRGVLQYLADLNADAGVEWRFLKGNHEAAMVDFLGKASEGEKWCAYGGDATLESYGLRVPQFRHKPEAWTRLAADLNHKLTVKERAFLDELELSVTVGDYFFAHAGARPGEALDRQTPGDLMWIRRSFLESPVEFDKVIVHGHTPGDDPHIDHRRIGIDTKAYESGTLTAVRLEGSQRTIVQAKAEAESVRISMAAEAM